MLDLARLPFASAGQATTGLDEAARLARSPKGRRDLGDTLTPRDNAQHAQTPRSECFVRTNHLAIWTR